MHDFIMIVADMGPDQTKILSCKPVKMLIEFIWDKIKPKIIRKIFLPFLLQAFIVIY